MTGYGPWTDHDGSGCPIPEGVTVITFGEWPSGLTLCAIGPCFAEAKAWDWTNYGMASPSGRLYGRVLRYRVKRTAAVQALVNMVESVKPHNEEARP